MKMMRYEFDIKTCGIWEDLIKGKKSVLGMKDKQSMLWRELKSKKI